MSSGFRIAVGEPGTEEAELGAEDEKLGILPLRK